MTTRNEEGALPPHRLQQFLDVSQLGMRLGRTRLVGFQEGDVYDEIDPPFLSLIDEPIEGTKPFLNQKIHPNPPHFQDSVVSEDQPGTFI